MTTNNLGLAIIALALFLGILFMGASIKYGMTRHACISAGLNADQCVQWNAYWERNAR